MGIRGHLLISLFHVDRLLCHRVVHSGLSLHSFPEPKELPQQISTRCGAIFNSMGFLLVNAEFT